MVRPEAVDYLQAGLKAVNLRQTVIANNIANLNTPGFRRGEVRFEALLGEALKSDGDADPSAVGPEILRSSSGEGDPQASDVSLDTEMGELVKNSAMHKAYFRLMAKLMKQMELAIQD
jgi:flagellar basal-body rod protein FlgB